jgi:GIY-YIG catalytic domain
MACKRSAVRSRLAPPRFALRATRGAATQCPAKRARHSPRGDDGLEETVRYVYIIRSINFPEQEYTGATADLKRRLPEHNAGKSTHTAKFKP